MRSLPLKSIAALMLAGASLPASADTVGKMLGDYRSAAARGVSTYQLDIDNDSLLLRGDDGFYTSGLRLTQYYTMRDAAKLTRFGWRVGQELYTGLDPKLPAASRPALDHPYAGWLYGGIFKETHRTDGSHENFGIDIGCLGPCAGGEWTQNTLHRIFNQPMTQGWSAQVRNEPGVVLYADVAPLRWTPAASIDITPRFYGRFGNIFTDAGAGVTIRAGQLNLLPDQATLHGFLRLDGRVVGYNATLQGGYFSRDNAYTVRPKRVVGEVEMGLMWQRARYGLSMSVVRRGNEISGLSNGAGAQNFARLQFSYTP
jgi:lipid A 3-O-deacylase